MALVVEGACNQHVEAGITRFARGFHQIRPGHGAEFRPNEYSRTSFGSRLPFALYIATFSADEIAWPRRQVGESYAVLFMRLLHSRSPEVLQNHLHEGGLSFTDDAAGRFS